VTIWVPPIFIVLGLVVLSWGMMTFLPPPVGIMVLMFTGFVILVILVRNTHRYSQFDERLTAHRAEIVLAVKTYMAESTLALEAQTSEIADKLRQETERIETRTREDQDQRHGKLSEQLDVIAQAATKAYDEANHSNQKFTALAVQQQGEKLDEIAATIVDAQTAAAAEHETIGAIEITTTETHAIVKGKFGSAPPSQDDPPPLVKP